MTDSRVETVNLEVQEGEGENWKSVGQVQLLDDSSEPDAAMNPAMGRRDQLPRCVKKLLTPTTEHRKLFYLFRHAQGVQPNTNLMILLHGFGDSHIPFDKLGQTMALPQTATLTISARSYEKVPFGLGYTYFKEMDYETGDPLPETHPVRRYSLQAAATKINIILKQLILEEQWIIPERVFFLGYGAGAALAVQSCVMWCEQGHSPLGGAVCVAGGASLLDDDEPIDADKATTPILLMVGEKDEYFSPANAERLQQLYGESVEIYIEPNKGQGMIQNQSEMQRVMEFLSRRLVRLSMLPS
jgi:predicted esterase